jgi:NAD(P)-dependent dehydrogenase (short-subunit alcohol dehydrogenase family)
MLHEQPLHRLGRNTGRGPRAGITGADFARIGKRGLQRRAGLAVNLDPTFLAARAVQPGMKAAGGGSIINFGSTSWMIGQGGMAVYTAAKSAVLGLTRSLARDYGPFNIRVNTVAPGWIMTERQIEKWLTPEGEAELMKRQCLKRRLQPAELAKFTLFLSSDEASACTNQNYIVDGGWV